MKSILWFTVMVTVGLYICGPIVDPDLWWHINVGRWILAHSQFPNIDYWTQLGVGQSWTPYSWLFEIIVSSIDNHFGVLGLVVAKALMGVVLAIVLGITFSVVSQSWFLGGVLSILCVSGSFSHFTLRPQSLTWILLGLIALVSEMINRKGINFKYGAMLTVLFSLWANIHLSALLGLLFLLFWFNDSRARILGLMAAFAGTILTPTFGGEWLTFFSKAGHPFSHRAIAEFQPATIMQYSTGFLICMVAFWGALAFEKRLKVKPQELILVGLFNMAGLVVIKFLPMALIVTAVSTSRLFRDGEASSTGITQAVGRLRSVWGRIPREGLTFVFLSLALVNFWKVWTNPMGVGVFPENAASKIIEDNFPGPILNMFGDGGYLSYRFSNNSGEPSRLVSIDGRTNVGPPELFDQQLNALRGAFNWNEYFKLIQPKTVIWRNESPLVQILKEREDWSLVYSDGSGDSGWSIFVEN